MSALPRLTPWTPKGATDVRRVYLHGGSVPAGAYLQLNRDTIELIAPELPAALARTHLQALLEGLCGAGLDPALLAPGRGRALWTALVALPPQAGPTRTRAPSLASRAAAVQVDESVLDVASIPVPGPVRIVVDHREPPEIIAALRQGTNVQVSVEALELGDYLINDTIVVERKAVADFQSSVIEADKRLFNQSERLKMSPEHLGIILLEGDLYGAAERMSVPQISGAVSYLCVIQGLSVLHSLGPRHTSYLLVKLASHHANGLGYDLSLRVNKPKAVLSAQRYLLEGLPGVAGSLAEALLAHFGTIQALAAASEAQLQQVPGVGPKTAAAIRAVFSTPAG